MLVGKVAPEIVCQAIIDNKIQDIKLSDFKNKYKVLFFYPLDFTFVCPTEIHAFQDLIEEFPFYPCFYSFLPLLLILQAGFL